MKVVKFELWECVRNENVFDAARSGSAPMPWDVVVLRLTADNGVSGVATACAARSGRITMDYLKEICAPVVLGRDATEREAIWQEFRTIDRHIAFFPNFITGPIDVALWDIAAKSANLPLFRYIGACRTSLPVYASSLWKNTPGDYVVEAKQYANRGFKAYKAHPPGPWRMDMEIHRALREELGAAHVLMTDPVADYTLETAIRVGRDLEKLDFYWFEEPFRDMEFSKYAELCRVLDIPVAATEALSGGIHSIAQVIALRAADIVRADVSWKQGVTGTIKAARLAEANGMQCEIHCTTMGPMDIANLHVSCAISNCEYFELLVPEDFFRFPMKDPYQIDAEGIIHVPEKPGLGVEIDWDAVEMTCRQHVKLEL